MADQSLRDIRIDPLTGDWASASATKPTSAAVSGDTAIGQHLRIRLRMIKGECPWDLDGGVDYFGTVFRKSATDSEIAADVQRVILGTLGITGLTSFALSRNPVTRLLSVAFSCTSDAGQFSTTVPLLEGV